VACIPQGEEVISWLKEIGWEGEGGMATTFARQAVCSLRDITNLSQEQLRKICHAKVSKEHSLPDEIQVEELEKYLNGAIDELKKSERSKDLQYRLDFFRDMTISGKDILFAHHGMEVMVTNPAFLCAHTLALVATLAYHAYRIYWYLPLFVYNVINWGFDLQKGNETAMIDKQFYFTNHSLSSSLHLSLFTCVSSVLYFVWHVRSKSPRVVSRNTILLWKAECVLLIINEILWCLYLTLFDLPNKTLLQASTNI